MTQMKEPKLLAYILKKIKLKHQLVDIHFVRRRK